MFDVPIHKLIVHFPIALMIIAAVYDAWALYTRRPELHRTAYALILWAAVGALAAVGTGLQLAEMIHLDKGAVTGHAGFGIASAIVIAGSGRLEILRAGARAKRLPPGLAGVGDRGGRVGSGNCHYGSSAVGNNKMTK